MHKIVAICQVYNELERGNLEHFFKYLKPHVSDIIIYDDASTDGTYEYCLEQTPYVIRGTKNAFKEEQFHKAKQLELAMTLKPDFIFQLDADEVLAANGDLQAWCDRCIKDGLDGINFHKLNLWRSATYRRIDSFYDDGWFTQLWRVGKGLSYENPKEGLHGRLIPTQIEKTMNADDFGILHYGFADDKNIAFKYFTYKRHGQAGYLMLDRLIDESKLELVEVPKDAFPEGLWQKESAPQARTIVESLEAMEQFRSLVRRPKYSVVCLIYKSVEWLQFSYEQVLKFTPLEDVEFFYVANNAEPHVLEYLQKQHIPHYDFRTTEAQRKEWYINDVYRAWNFAAEQARGDFVIFINSDMAFSPGWFENLVAGYNGKNCVAGRLVESGKLRTGMYGIERNFGRSIKEYKEKEFLEYAASIQGPEINDGGLFMPLLIKKSDFLMVGGYPEGNARPGSDIFKPELALRGEEVVPGDAIFMQKLATKGITHQTTWASVTYHFQEGEMDENATSKDNIPVEPVAIVNDLVTGTMGERVLWDFMLEQIPGAYGVDQRLVGKKNFETAAKAYIDEQHPDTKVIIQNATFIGTVDPERYAVAFVQDDLRKMGRESVTQEKNLASAQKVVANSVQTAASYLEYDTEIISVGLDDQLFRPLNRKELRKKHDLPDGQIGIFVGSFDEVKGWSKVEACIKKYPKITWLCVTKKETDNFEAPNARVFTRIKQELLVELLNCADFFIIGSPVETQCLAALEAALCDIPVVMPLTGIFEDFTEAERNKVGIFGDNLVASVKALDGKKFSPRKLVLEKGLTVATAMQSWNKLLERILLVQRAHQLRGTVQPVTVKKINPGMLVRKVVLKRLIGREYIFPSTIGYAILRGTYKTLVRLGLEPVIKKIRR